MEISKFFTVSDELNLFLVSQGIKPATLSCVDARRQDYDEYIFKGTAVVNGIGYSTRWVPPDEEAHVIRTMEDLGVPFDIDHTIAKSTFYGPEMEETGGLFYSTIMALVGADQEKLERLLTAQSHKERGEALGFPKEAVKFYGKIVDGERRDGSYVAVNMGRAKQAGVEIPTWLAYISFVPEQLDLAGGNISPTSEALGKRYQGFVREHNPTLAKRVEEKFKDYPIPDRWEKAPNGGYNVERDLI